jgi:hypothetical protein
VPINETFGWSAILAGFVSGMLLGLGFHRDEFLGGYASLRRRMLRLGHIALVALGALNVLFAQSAPRMKLEPGVFVLASNAWIAGGIAMPLCCALMAWRAGFRLLFALPVVCLILAASLTLAGLVHP